MSDTETRCDHCGRPLPADAPRGLCPYCLLMPAQTQSHAAAFDPPAPAELQAHFEGLDIVELLGRGGMGAVYLGRQRHLDRAVAVKILPPETASQAGFESRFTREARTLANLSHPGIVTVYDFGKAGPYAYLLMEYIDGVNLRELMAGDRLPPAEAMRIVPALCDALQYAHERGVIHRDVKPENVLLSGDGRVKVADFGLARVVTPGSTRLTGSRQVMGTPHYMAPEQIEHPEDVDHRADIYALGVVFYEMLTGGLPLGRFEPPSVFGGPKAADRVVDRSLEKDRDRRYDSASAVRVDLERGDAAEPVSPATGRGAAVAAALGNYADGARAESGRRDRSAVVGLYAALAYVSPLLGLLLANTTPKAYEAAVPLAGGLFGFAAFSLAAFRKARTAYPPLASVAVGMGQLLARPLQPPESGPRALTGLAGLLGEPRPPLEVIAGAFSLAGVSFLVGGIIASNGWRGPGDDPLVFGFWMLAATGYLTWAWRDRIGRRLGLNEADPSIKVPASDASPSQWPSRLSSTAGATARVAQRAFWPVAAIGLTGILALAGLTLLFLVYPLPIENLGPDVKEMIRFQTSSERFAMAAASAAAVLATIGVAIAAGYAVARALPTGRQLRLDNPETASLERMPDTEAPTDSKRTNGFALASAAIPAFALLNPVIGATLLNFESPIPPPDPVFLAIMEFVSLTSAVVAGRLVRRGQRTGAWLAVVGPLPIPVVAALAVAFDWRGGPPDGETIYPWLIWVAVRAVGILAAAGVAGWVLRRVVYGDRPSR